MWLVIGAIALVVVDGGYQLARKPSDIVTFVAPSSTKTPRATWSEYGALFRENATEVVRPELLAALVQVESSGDPMARTPWRLRWTWNPLRFYAPASSAVGILQITDGTFAEAQRYCIHDHAVARDGPWYDPRTCWFNGLYFRSIPSHAIEMTAARLHVVVSETLAQQRAAGAAPEQKLRLAAVIHLCGKERAAAFAHRRFRLLPGERCGDQDVGQYVARVQQLAATFQLIARTDTDGRTSP
jgi:hypothetical protein